MNARATAAVFLAVSAVMGFGPAGRTISHPVSYAQPPAAPAPGQPLPVTLTPSGIRPASSELLALGKRLYEAQCAACHGIGGHGDGEAAYLLYPKPRDFVAAQYRLVSTWERVPTDEDLFRTVSRGIPEIGRASCRERVYVLV